MRRPAGEPGSWRAVLPTLIVMSPGWVGGECVLLGRGRIAGPMDSIDLKGLGWSSSCRAEEEA